MLPGFPTEGGPGPFFRDHRRPAIPRGVAVSVPEIGTIKVVFQDQGAAGQGVFGRSTSVLFWKTMYLRSENAPLNPTGQTVLDRGTQIDTTSSAHNGATITLFLHVPNVASVWVVVVGVSDEGIVGIPSFPQLVDVSKGTVAGANGLVTLPIGPILKSLVTDIYGNQFVLIEPGYYAPKVLGSFFGMELHCKGAYGVQDIMELGNIVTYPFPDGGQGLRGKVLLPVDPGPWNPNGTASFSLGGVTVTRVSGPNFDTSGAWTGKKLRAVNGDGNLYTIGNVPTINTITLAFAYTGAGGTYTMQVMNDVTYYFVNLDRAGSRPADVTTCPNSVDLFGINP